MFAPFRARDDLHVLVSAASADLQAFVERQRGAAVVGRNATLVQYRLPREGRFDLDEPAGAPLPLASVSATVSPEDVGYVADRNLRSVWHAPQDRDASVTIELEGNSTVGAVVFALGSYHANFPRRLVVETSLDGGVWEAGWDGEVLEHVVRAAFARPDRMDVVVAFEARRARFVRLRQVGRDAEYQWSIAELGVRPGR